PSTRWDSGRSSPARQSSTVDRRSERGAPEAGRALRPRRLWAERRSAAERAARCRHADLARTHGELAPLPARGGGLGGWVAGGPDGQLRGRTPEPRGRVPRAPGPPADLRGGRGRVLRFQPCVDGGV